MKLRIYVAGPYSAETPELVRANVDRAVRIGVELAYRGHYPVVPHTTWLLEQEMLVRNRTMPYQYWLDLTAGWLECCDALYYIASSPGADRELRDAMTEMMPIYRSLEDVPDEGSQT